MSDSAGESDEFGMIAVALLVESAFFETGLSEARKNELKKQLFIFTQGTLDEADFEAILKHRIIKRGEFLSPLSALASVIRPSLKRPFADAIERIISADGNLSDSAKIHLEKVRSILKGH